MVVEVEVAEEVEEEEVVGCSLEESPNCQVKPHHAQQVHQVVVVLEVLDLEVLDLVVLHDVCCMIYYKTNY